MTLNTRCPKTGSCRCLGSRYVPFGVFVLFAVGLLVKPAATGVHNPHEVLSSAQLVFLVGVEGTGHHGVKKFMYSLFREAGRKVLTAGEDKEMRAAVEARDEQSMLLHATKFVTQNSVRPRPASLSPTTPVIFFKGSFPGREHVRGSCLKENGGNGDCMSSIENYPFYDIGWIARLFRPFVRSVHVILLDRDFYNSAASHRDWDGGLLQHATVLAVYKEFISRQVLTHFDPTEWCGLHYESLTGTLSDMESVADRLASFLGWNVNAYAVVRRSHFRASSRNASLELQANEVSQLRVIVDHFLRENRWQAYKQF